MSFQNLDFKYISAQNFLCFGPEGIEIDFTKFNNIVLIRGKNLDVHDAEERIASNGVGKTSIAEILVYTLFGKTIKQPKKLSHKDVINNQTGKGLRTEVRWGNYRVVRSRKPDSLRIWESEDGIWDDEHEISLGGMPATQELIIEKIGLNYDTFINVAIYTDNNSGCFLECDASTKREVVENLMQLSKYREYGEKSKSLRNEYKNTVKTLLRDYELWQTELARSQNRVEQAVAQETQWKRQKKTEIQALIKRVEEKKTVLEQSEDGLEVSRYEDAQIRISELINKIPSLEESLALVEERISKANEKKELGQKNKHEHYLAVTNAEDAVKQYRKKLSELEAEVREIESKKDTKCKFCWGKVSEENYGPYIQQIKNKISHVNAELMKQTRLKEIAEQKYEKTSTNLDTLIEAMGAAKERKRAIAEELNLHRGELFSLEQIPKPSGDVANQVLKQEIRSLKEQILQKKEEYDGNSPYKTIIDTAKKEAEVKAKECQEKQDKLQEAEAKLPYYEFWVTAFGDSGIRKFVIDGIIPALNSRVAYWLQFLIDGRIKLEFDNQLEETIQRNPVDGDPFVYHAMSGGERRRLNLAVSQAFAYVMMLNCGRSPSLVFLDEVTTNIDPIGVVGVYNMIMELAKERQVFVTTHDQSLLEALEGCESINLQKKNGFTTLVD